MSSLFFLSRCPRWRGLEDDQVWCRRAVEPAAPARFGRRCCVTSQHGLAARFSDCLLGRSLAPPALRDCVCFCLDQARELNELARAEKQAEPNRARLLARYLKEPYRAKPSQLGIHHFKIQDVL